MKRGGLLICCLCCGLLALYAQPAYVHSLFVQGKAGYSMVTAPANEMSPLGGMGTGIGVGYEYRHKDFLFQTGLDLQRIASRMTIGMYTHTMPMRDTSGRPFCGIFEFNHNSERHSMVGVAMPVMAGVALRDWYILAGVKLQLNVGGTVNTSSSVTSRARYDMIVGDDGDGLLSDMPNHGLTTTSREIESKLPLFPVYQLSAEVGKTFRPHPAVHSNNARTEYLRQVRANNRSFERPAFSGHAYRLTFFCDYGFASLKKQTAQAEPFVNIALQPQAYTPTLNHVVCFSNRMNSLFVGLKFSVLFEFASKYDCQCY